MEENEKKVITTVLVLTSRDVGNDGGEASLMESKRKFLLKEGVALKYFLFRKRKIEEVKKCTVGKPMSRWTIFFPFLWLLPLMSQIKKEKVQWLVISSPFLYFSMPIFLLLKLKGLRVSLDYQGCLEELLEYNHIDKPYYRRLSVYLVLKLFEFIFVKFCADLVEVVSENGKKYIREKYFYNGRVAVIPCGVEEVFSEEEWFANREKWRARFCISPEEDCFVYCGGLSPWQNVDKVLDFCRENATKKVFIFTSRSNHSYLESLGIPNLNIGFLPHDQMVGALCAFDYGFLLRKSDMTNYVAYPNKYSEYVNARLKVILLSKDIGCISAGSNTFIFMDDLIKGKRMSCQDQSNFQNEAIKTSYGKTIPFLAGIYLAG